MSGIVFNYPRTIAPLIVAKASLRLPETSSGHPSDIFPRNATVKNLTVENMNLTKRVYAVLAF